MCEREFKVHTSNGIATYTESELKDKFDLWSDVYPGIYDSIMVAYADANTEGREFDTEYLLNHLSNIEKGMLPFDVEIIIELFFKE